MRFVVVLLLVAALVFVGVSAFGSVDQFETDVTAEALILPSVERGESMVLSFGEDAVYTGAKTVTYNYFNVELAAVSNYNAEAVLTDRLKFPTSAPP